MGGGGMACITEIVFVGNAIARVIQCWNRALWVARAGRGTGQIIAVPSYG
jgi:hypothetical protein